MLFHSIPSRLRQLSLFHKVSIFTSFSVCPPFFRAGQVEWSTWGSKLESIFLPVFSTLPSLVVRAVHAVLLFELWGSAIV
jgi:hypothetical protein